MAGLINTGTGYRDTALAGFVRESGEQTQEQEANEQLDAQRKIQKAQLGAEGAMIGGIGGYLAAGSTTLFGAEGSLLSASAATAPETMGLSLAAAGVGMLMARLF